MKLIRLDLPITLKGGENKRINIHYHYLDKIKTLLQLAKMFKIKDLGTI